MRNPTRFVDVTVDQLRDHDGYMDAFCNTYWSTKARWWRGLTEPGCGAYKSGYTWKITCSFPGWLPQWVCRWMCIRVLRREGVDWAVVTSSRSLIYDSEGR